MSALLIVRSHKTKQVPIFILVNISYNNKIVVGRKTCAHLYHPSFSSNHVQDHGTIVSWSWMWLDEKEGWYKWAPVFLPANSNTKGVIMGAIFWSVHFRMLAPFPKSLLPSGMAYKLLKWSVRPVSFHFKAKNCLK